MHSNQHSKTSESKQTNWKQMSEAWESSGLSQKQFCKEQAISYFKFLYWRSQFKQAKQKTPSGKPALLPVEIKQTKPSSSSVNGMLSIQTPQGLKITIPSDERIIDLVFKRLGVTP